MREIVMSLGLVGMQRDQFEEGFVDQHGVFYDRREAYRVAARNGQIKRRCGGDAADGGTLYSENLY